MSCHSKSQANLTLRPTSPERLTTQLRWAFCWRAPSGDGHPDHWFERLRRRRAPPRKMQSASGGIVCEQSRGLFLLLIKFFLLDQILLAWLNGVGREQIDSTFSSAAPTTGNV